MSGSVDSSLSLQGRGTGALARQGEGTPAASADSPLPTSPLARPPSPLKGEGISDDTSRLKSKANLKQAGEKFEAVFTGMMLKSMRQAKLADPLFDSKAIDTFSEMQDARVAQAMAEHQPMGIGKAMTDFLARSQSDLNASAAEPPA